MKKIFRNEIIVAILAVMIWYLGFNLLGTGVEFIFKHMSRLNVQFVAEILALFWALIINKLFTHVKIKVVRWDFFKRSYLYAFFLLSYLLMIIASFYSKQIAFSFKALILTLAVGSCEELIVRGVALGKLLEKYKTTAGIYLSIILSSVLFAALHIGNVSIQPLSNTLIQVGYTFFMGIIFACFYLRTANIFSTIILHATLDFIGISYAFTQNGDMKSTAGWPAIILFGVLAIITMLTQLRGQRMDLIKREFGLE